MTALIQVNRATGKVVEEVAKAGWLKYAAGDVLLPLTLSSGFRKQRRHIKAGPHHVVNPYSLLPAPIVHLRGFHQECILTMCCVKERLSPITFFFFFFQGPISIQNVQYSSHIPYSFVNTKGNMCNLTTTTQPQWIDAHPKTGWLILITGTRRVIETFLLTVIQIHHFYYTIPFFSLSTSDLQSLTTANQVHAHSLNKPTWNWTNSSVMSANTTCLQLV